MHSSSKIKICKITSKPFAKYCIEMGVDLLGVHVLMYKKDPLVKELFSYIESLGGKSVLLTKETSPDLIKELEEYYRPSYIQIHAHISRENLIALSHTSLSPIIPVITDNTSVKEARDLIEQSIFVVYDTSYRGGTGQTHSWKLLKTLSDAEKSKILLAGGISPDLIIKNKDVVGGYDIQSYTRPDGAPSYARATQVIQAAHGNSHGMVDVSLTDAKELSIPSYEDLTGLHGFHLDYSKGNLYKEFVVDTRHIEETLESYDAPFTIHIFESDPSSYQAIIDRLMLLNKEKITCVNIQYSQGLDIDAIDTHTAKKCISLYYKDLDEYFSRNRKDACLSIIIPSEEPRRSEIIERYSSLLSSLNDREVWYDRKMDASTAKKIVQISPNANFIAGQFIVNNWGNLYSMKRAIVRHASI